MRNKSFTLIELLVVIVIIGILAGVIIVSTSSSINKANFAKGQAFSSTVRNELLLNLVSEWSFDNLTQSAGTVLSADTSIEDEWGNYNGLSKGTLTVKDGSDCIKGKCLSFDGSTGYVLIPTFNIGNSATVSFWAKSNAYIGRMTFSFNSDDYTAGPDFYFISSGPLWNTGDGGGNPFTNSSIPNSDWHYFVIVNNENSNTQLYIDGTKIGTAAYRSVKTTANTFFIGKYDNSSSYNFNGIIDEFNLFNAPLNTSQVKELYAYYSNLALK